MIPGELTDLVVSTTGSNAMQTVARANTVDAPMYSVSQAKREDAYSAFGEKAALQLIRPFPVIRFTTANTDEYIEYFGKLKSVELTALGAKKDDGSVLVAASNLAYDRSKNYTIIGNNKGFAAGYAPATTPEKVTVNLSDGTWSDDKAVYMTVAPVDRKAFKDASAQEALKVVYEFTNITFTLDGSDADAPEFEQVLKTSNDWSAVDKNGNPNAITPLPALDINNYNYLVVGSGTTNKTLIVIKGNFKDVFANATNVSWEGGEVACTAFSTIISNVELTAEEMATLGKFTSLKSLTLKKNTTIPANTFVENQKTTLTELNLPKVTSVDKKFIANDETAAFSALKTLLMPAYEFNLQSVNAAFFNNSTKTSLKTLDMSGVTSMLPTFGIERTLKFEGYALEEVTVKDGVIVSPSAFAACENLETVNGIVNIESAPNAFAMTSGNPNNALESIKISSGKIPASAFEYCAALETVTCNDAAVIPTEIGSKAFYHATALTYMDLSQATTIGASAFASTGLISANKNTDVLTVGVAEVPNAVFANTAVRMVKFTNATKISGSQIFVGASNLIQIKFLKVITLAGANSSTFYKTTFGTTANVDLWTNPDQPGVDGKNFTLSYNNTGTTPATVTPVTWTFASIQKKIED